MSKGAQVMNDRITAQEAMQRVNLRRRKAESLVGAIMEEITNKIPRCEHHGEIHRVLLDVFERNGASIITETDRAEMGLEPRDEFGWTPSEIVEHRRRRMEYLTSLMNAPIMRDTP